MYEELMKKLRSHNGWALNETLDKAADAIEELQKVLDAVHDAHNEGYDVGYWAGRRDYEPKWIPATERLPKKNELVLVRSKFVKTRIDFINNDGYWHMTPAVTHWMPLPEPPKEES